MDSPHFWRHIRNIYGKNPDQKTLVVRGHDLRTDRIGPIAYLAPSYPTKQLGLSAGS